MRKPNRQYVSRVKQEALKQIYGEPDSEVQKLPALVELLNKQGHSCKLILKSPNDMLKTISESAKTALSYERKQKIIPSYFDFLMKESINDAILEEIPDDARGKIKTEEEFLIETVGEYKLEELRSENTNVKYLYGILFIPVTSKRLAMAGLMPNVWTGDGAHMYTMGTFLNFVFRDGNHKIHNAATLLAFDNECSESWSCLMQFAIDVYGKQLYQRENARVVADRDKGFDKSFDKFLAPLGVNRFCCSNHMGENISTKFKKDAKGMFLNAVKAATKLSCDTFVDKLPKKLKDSIGQDEKKQMFLAYIGDNTGGLTIHTNNNSESFNNKHRVARGINVVSALKEIMVSDRLSHEKSKIASSVEVEGNFKTLTKGLKGTTWYKERVVHGKALYDQQRIIPLGDLKANVVGGTGTYNVDLRTFKCDCNTFACKHLFGTAQYYNIDIDSFFPEKYKVGYYHQQLKALQEYPPFPSSAAISGLSEFFDNTLSIPIGGKRSRGAPKKGERKRSMKEQVWKENKKRSAIMK